MRALRFIIAGKLAHFRRFYTNSSSLTYPIPPPPTLRGLLGAALGLGPEYADNLADLRFSVRPLTPWRFLMQTANYLKIKKGELNLAGGEHTQIPLQFVAPRTLDGRLRYEVLTVGEGVESLLNALRRPHYPLSLGPAYALAQVEEVGLCEGEWEEGFAGLLRGPLIVRAIKAVQGNARLFHDRYPLKLARNRIPILVEDLAIEKEGNSVRIEYQGAVFRIGEEAWALVE